MNAGRTNPIERKETVTAVIVTWNSGVRLRECLLSLLGNRSNIGVQTLVVDNASADDSVEWVAHNFPTVEVIINTENHGFARACNQGIRAGRGRYILLLNPDTLLDVAAVDEMVAYMDAHPEVAIVGPKLLNPDGSRQLSCRRFPTYSAALFNRTSLLTRLFPLNRFSSRYLRSDQEYGQVEGVDWVAGACMLVRREAIDDVGLLDESFFLFCEDVDWCKRMWANDWKVVFFPKAEGIHHIGHSTAQAPFRSIIEQNKSIWRYYKKHFQRGAIRDTVTFTGVAVRCGLLVAVALFRALGGKKTSGWTRIW